MTAKTMFDPTAGTVGADGATYAVLNNFPQSSGKGIARVTPDGKCSVVTLSASATNKGAGPEQHALLLRSDRGWTTLRGGATANAG